MKTIDRIETAIGTAWCSMWHDDIYWPVNGTYKCRTCHRVYPVNWDNHVAQPKQSHGSSVRAFVASPSEG
jgi:hypothetical protein